MRFGICAGPNSVAQVGSLGYDYIEFSAADVLRPVYPDSDVVLPEIDVASHITPEAFNGLVGFGVKVVGPERDEATLLRYADNVTRRAALLGGKILVYGSSGSRNVPDGYSRDKANDEIVSFLKIIAGPAKLHGVAIAIEPLGRAECNIINTVDEGVEIAQRVGLPQQITVLADLYHMLCNGESLASVQRAASLGLLSHVHVACGRDRHSPRPEDIDTLREFLSYAKQAPVVPRCSLECRLVDFEHDAHVALDVLKEATR